MNSEKNQKRTREKIMSSAGKLFAKKGFEPVSVRDICRHAKVHHGALNYHFNNKEELYRQIVLAICKEDEITPKNRKELDSLPAPTALQILISETIKTFRSDSNRNWQIRLMLHEYLTPSPAFKEAIKLYFIPTLQYFAKLTGEIVNKSANDPQVIFAVISLFSLIETFCSYSNFIVASAPEIAKAVKKDKKLSAQLYKTTIQLAEDKLIN